LVHQVIISIQFVESLFKHFQLEIKVHSHRTSEAYQAGMDLDSVLWNQARRAGHENQCCSW
jgi:hypothetical protein